MWPLPGFLVRRVSPAPSAELPELDAIRGVPPALHCLVVPTLALFASHRHCDALACCHRLTTPVRGRASGQVTTRHARGRGAPECAAGPCRRRGPARRRVAAGGRADLRRRRPRRRRRRAARAGGGGRAGGRGRSRPARRRGRGTSDRRRYSLTSGGRALALGEPAERTRWQSVWTSDTVAGLVGAVIASLPVRRPSRAASSRGPGVDGQQESPSAGADLELLLDVEDVVAAAAGVAAHAQRRLGVRVERAQGRGRGSRVRGRSTRARRGGVSPCGWDRRGRDPTLDPRACGLLRRNVRMVRLVPARGPHGLGAPRDPPPPRRGAPRPRLPARVGGPVARATARSTRAPTGSRTR